MTAGTLEAGPSATVPSSARRQRILRNGVSRGMTEFRHAMRRPRETLLPLAFTVAVAIVLSSVVGRHGVSGTSVPTSDLFVAGYLSYGIVSQGLVSLPQVLGTEREDGTLLRMRNIPGGIPAYLISKVVSQGLQALMSTAILLLAAVLFVGFPAPGSVADWLLLVGVLTVGFVAVMLAGAAIGAVLPSPRGSLALVSLFVLGLMFISGVFYPVTSMPRALQLLGEIFPLKWMAQGVRAATLPDTLKTVETGGSWQISLVFGVLASWIALGAVLAPRLLRRMTRRQSGSSLQTRRERAQRRLLA